MYPDELYIYRHSVFDGCITLRDIHGKVFLISDGDTLNFRIVKAENDTFTDVFTLNLTADDEVQGKYPFKISSEVTDTLYGLYYYSVSVGFADGDVYTAVPFTKLHAVLPLRCIGYHEQKNEIVGIVPRVMAGNSYVPFSDELAEFLKEFQNDSTLVTMYAVEGCSVIFVRRCTSVDDLVRIIKNTAANYGLKRYFVAGFFHDDPQQYSFVFRNIFGNYFIDVQEILKTPVFDNATGDVISSIAFDKLRQKTTPTDILSIVNGEYPVCIMQDETHFNDKGLKLIAQTILQEANAIE